MLTNALFQNKKPQFSENRLIFMAPEKRTVPLPTREDLKKASEKQSSKKEKASKYSAYTYNKYYDKLAGKPDSKERTHFEKNFNKFIQSLGTEDNPIIEKVQRGDTFFNLFSRAVKNWLKTLKPDERKKITKLICGRPGKKSDLSIDRGLKKLSAKVAANFATLGFDIGHIKADHNGQTPDHLVIQKGYIGIHPNAKIETKGKKKTLRSDEAFIIGYLPPKELQATPIPKEQAINIPAVRNAKGEIVVQGYTRPKLQAIPPAKERPLYPAIPELKPVWKFTNKTTRKVTFIATDKPGQELQKLGGAQNFKSKEVREAYDGKPATSEVIATNPKESAVRVFRPFKTAKASSERMYLEKQYTYEKGQLIQKTKSRLNQLKAQVDRGPWAALSKLLGRNVTPTEVKQVYAKLHEIARNLKATEILKSTNDFKISIPKDHEYKERGIANREKNVFIINMLKYIYFTDNPLPQSAKDILRSSTLRPIKLKKSTRKKATSRPAPRPSATSQPASRPAPKPTKKTAQKPAPTTQPTTRTKTTPTRKPAPKATPQKSKAQPTKSRPSQKPTPTTQPATKPAPRAKSTPIQKPKPQQTQTRRPAPTPNYDKQIDDLLEDYEPTEPTNTYKRRKPRKTPIQVYDDVDTSTTTSTTTRSPRQSTTTQPTTKLKPTTAPQPPKIASKPEKNDRLAQLQPSIDKYQKLLDKHPAIQSFKIEPNNPNRPTEYQISYTLSGLGSPTRSIKIDASHFDPEYSNTLLANFLKNEKSFLNSISETQKFLSLQNIKISKPFFPKNHDYILSMQLKDPASTFPMIATLRYNRATNKSNLELNFGFMSKRREDNTYESITIPLNNTNTTKKFNQFYKKFQNFTPPSATPSNNREKETQKEYSPTYISGHSNLESALKKAPHSIVIFSPYFNCPGCTVVKNEIKNKKFKTQVIYLKLTQKETEELLTAGTKMNKYAENKSSVGFPFYREFKLDSSKTPKLQPENKNNSGPQNILKNFKEKKSHISQTSVPKNNLQKKEARINSGVTINYLRTGGSKRRNLIYRLQYQGLSTEITIPNHLKLKKYEKEKQLHLQNLATKFKKITNAYQALEKKPIKITKEGKSYEITDLKIHFDYLRSNIGNNLSYQGTISGSYQKPDGTMGQIDYSFDQYKSENHQDIRKHLKSSLESDINNELENIALNKQSNRINSIVSKIKIDDFKLTSSRYDATRNKIQINDPNNKEITYITIDLDSSAIKQNNSELKNHINKLLTKKIKEIHTFNQLTQKLTQKPESLNNFKFSLQTLSSITITNKHSLPSGAKGVQITTNNSNEIELNLDNESGKFTEFTWGKSSDNKPILKFKTTTGEQGSFKFIDPNNINASTVLAKCNTSNNYTPIQSITSSGIRKPIIYLYPLKKTKINVQVKINDGTIFAEYPKRNKSGWQVTAEPSGLITDNKSRQYNYLFWEAQKNKPFQINKSQAFCVKGKESVEFLEKSLKTLGLSDNEINDFITYWMGEMQTNPYNLIQFVEEEYTNFAPLEITPTPDTLIRVFMIFKSSNEKIKTGNPKLKQAKRKGYTVVEWGGSNLDQN